MSLLEVYNVPFAVAICLLIFIAAMQVIGIGDIFESAEADFDVDGDFDLDVDAVDGVESVGVLDGLLSIIGLGKVPFLIWLALLLVIFSAIGVSGQSLAIGLLGSPFDPLAAGALAALAALPLNGLAVRPVAAIMPRDETSAVGLNSLVRRDAEIQTGMAAHGSPARAKVTDRHGHAHFVMVEPHDPQAVLQEGEVVMLVRREGERFFAIQYESPMLTVD